MSDAYKVDERVLKNIISRNVTCTNQSKMELIIYYKNRKTSNCVMNNNLSATKEKLQFTNVVYKFTCPKEDCAPIGRTTTTLSRRISCHLQSGSPKDNFQAFHGERLTRKIFEDNVTILKREHDKNKLSITEAIFIAKEKPSMNIQNSNFDRALKLFNLILLFLLDQ